MATVLNIDEYRRGASRRQPLTFPINNMKSLAPERSRELAKQYLANAAALLAHSGESGQRVGWLIEDCVALLAEEQLAEA